MTPRLPPPDSPSAGQSFDLLETSSIAPFETDPASRPCRNHDTSASPLDLFVARIHRGAAAPHGYRFVANVDAADLWRALFAVKYASRTGELRLITPAVDNAGNRVPEIALYVRDHLPEPESFWSMFYSLGQSNAA